MEDLIEKYNGKVAKLKKEIANCDIMYQNRRKDKSINVELVRLSKQFACINLHTYGTFVGELEKLKKKG